MTWKNSFFKLTLHDIKKRSWCMALFFIAGFFVIPVRALLSAQRYREMYSPNAGTGSNLTEITQLFERQVFDFADGTLLLMLIAGAVVMSISGYSYLNSKKKVDFIHSMPIRREALFLSRYAAGFFLYMAPLILNAGLGLLIAVVSKGVTIYTVKSVLWFLLYQAVYFLLFYGTSVLAIVLIGNFVVSFLGIGVLCGYQTVMWYIIEIFKESFFMTHMGEYQTLKSCDPLGILLRQIGSFEETYFTYDYAGRMIRTGEESYYSTGGKICLIALVGAVIAGAAALLLFRMRKSESAGKSLVFSKAEPVVKAALLLPCGAIGGMVLYGIANGYRRIWYIFGAVLFFLISAVIIEIVFQQDFKSLFKHKISAAAGAGLILIFTLCFWLDIPGYDSRIPKTDRIVSVGISIPVVENQVYSGLYSDGSWDGSSKEYALPSIRDFFRHINYEEDFENVCLQNCEITEKEEIEKVRKLAGYYADNKEKFGPENSLDYAAMQETWEERQLENDKSAKYIECQVVYRLKNGENVYRTYRMPYGKDFLEVMEPVFANEEYKMSSDAIFDDSRNYRYLITENSFTDKITMIASSSREELLECFRKDKIKMTFKEAWTENKKGVFRMTDSFGSNMSVGCDVYEGYTNTLGWLSEHKADLEISAEEIQVESVHLQYWGNSQKIMDITDKQEQMDILPYLVRTEFAAPGKSTVYDTMTAVVEYTYKGEKNQTINGADYFHSKPTSLVAHYFFKEVPPFVKEKL